MTFRRGTRFLRVSCTVFAFSLFVTLATGTMAFGQDNPTSLFQLDGGASQNTSYPKCSYSGVTGTTTCDYWNLLNPTAGTNHSNVSVFVTNEGLSAITNFTVSDKDTQDISQWSCGTHSTPTKDDINNGYAAAYTAPSDNHLVVAFGADRNSTSTSGDANIGIWFFQQNAQCNTATGTFTIGNTTTVAHHVPKDLFVVSAFTIGGTTSGLNVYEWDPTCTKAGSPSASCFAKNLNTVFSSTNAPCDTTFGVDSDGYPTYGASGTLEGSLGACATTNSSASAGTASNWPYPTLVNTIPSSIPALAFFTGGADVSALVGNLCFSSFVMETRASASADAQLKGLIGHSFPICGLSITKACTGSVPNPTSFTDSWSGSVCNTGFGTLTNAVVTDTLPDGTTTDPTLSSTTLGPKGSATACATYSVSFNTTSLSATNTASVNASFGGASLENVVCTSNAGCPTGDACVIASGQSSGICEPTAQGTCTNTASSTVSIFKHCVPPTLSDLSCSGSGCVVRVPISAQVCNQSSIICTPGASNPQCTAVNMTCGAAGYCIGTAQVDNINVSDSPATLSAMTPNGFALNPGDCTGGAINTSLPCTSNAQCPTDYICTATQTGSFCATPPNPTGTYQPTSFDGSSTGNSNGRFLFDDTVSVTGATAAVGGVNPASFSCPGTGQTVQACAGQTCPLCPLGECSANALP